MKDESTECVPTLDTIRSAGMRIAPHSHRTPVQTCSALDALAGASLFFKCENFQKVGAFKFRGACNAVFSLSDSEAKRGVVAHSAGNHAQALALAAKLRGIPAWIVMPENAPDVKKAAVEGYGATVSYCAPTLRARDDMTARIAEETMAVFVHPYDDYRVIAGQATAVLEFLEDVPDLDAIIAPVSGGGLLAGAALVAHHMSPRTRVLGAEPLGADDACRSLKAGHILPSENPVTIADGLLTSLGERNFPIIHKYVSAIHTVTEDEIKSAMRFVWERMKLVIEPSAGVAVAVALQQTQDTVGNRVGVILSGGNVDFGLYT